MSWVRLQQLKTWPDFGGVRRYFLRRKVAK